MINPSGSGSPDHTNSPHLTVFDSARLSTPDINSSPPESVPSISGGVSGERKRWFPHRILDVLFRLPQTNCYVCGMAWETSFLMGSGPMCGCEEGKA